MFPDYIRPIIGFRKWNYDIKDKKLKGGYANIPWNLKGINIATCGCEVYGGQAGGRMLYHAKDGKGVWSDKHQHDKVPAENGSCGFHAYYKFRPNYTDPSEYLWRCNHVRYQDNSKLPRIYVSKYQFEIPGISLNSGEVLLHDSGLRSEKSAIGAFVLPELDQEQTIEILAKRYGNMSYENYMYFLNDACRHFKESGVIIIKPEDIDDYIESVNGIVVTEDMLSE